MNLVSDCPYSLYPSPCVINSGPSVWSLSVVPQCGPSVWCMEACGEHNGACCFLEHILDMQGGHCVGTMRSRYGVTLVPPSVAV